MDKRKIDIAYNVDNVYRYIYIYIHIQTRDFECLGLNIDWPTVDKTRKLAELK